jgi:hypothetical protein
MKKKIKNGLLAFIFVILLLPLLQQNLQVIDSGKLYGYYTNSPDIDFSWQKWFDGTYQEGKTNFLNDHLGFRPDLLRLNGQIDYSIFQKIDYGGAVMGSDNYMYYDEYINAYYGRDYKGYDVLHGRMMRLKALQDTLSHLGKTLILVYAPCKVWYYPEHIPWNLRSSISRPNNYKTSERIGDSLGINQIDLNKWFLTLKDTSREMLYSKQGIHWTNYGSILGCDSLIKYIEQLRHIHMPHPKWLNLLHTTDARDPDNDMGKLSNLIFPVVKETYCYPELYYTGDTTATKPDLIFVGDSYSANLIRTGVMQHMGRRWQFWMGFKNVLNDNDNYGTQLNIASYDWKSEMGKADCIIVLNTPMNTFNIGGGFIEAAYDYYYYPKK